MCRIRNVILDEDSKIKNFKIMESHYLLIDTNIILDQVMYFEMKDFLYNVLNLKFVIF